VSQSPIHVTILWLEINGVLKDITKSVNNNFFQRNQKEKITSNLLRTFYVFGKQHLSNFTSKHSKFLTHQNNSISNCSLPPWKPSFRPRTVHIEFIFDEVNLGQAYLRVNRFPPGNNLSTDINYSLISIFDMCERPHHPAHNHTLHPYLRFHLTWHMALGWYQRKDINLTHGRSSC
jgi:hypothetical protein